MGRLHTGGIELGYLQGCNPHPWRKDGQAIGGKQRSIGVAFDSR